MLYLHDLCLYSMDFEVAFGCVSLPPDDDLLLFWVMSPSTCVRVTAFVAGC